MVCPQKKETAVLELYFGIYLFFKESMSFGCEPLKAGDMVRGVHGERDVTDRVWWGLRRSCLGVRERIG